jgi:hypothetical protein
MSTADADIVWFRCLLHESKCIDGLYSIHLSEQQFEHLLGIATTLAAQQRRIEELEGAAENNRRLVWCAIQNAKRMPETWDEVGDPGPYNGPLWARVAHLLGLGSTSATALCREHGEDPEWRAALQPQGTAGEGEANNG